MQAMETTGSETFGEQGNVKNGHDSEAQVEEDPLEKDAKFFESLLRMPDQNRMTIGMQLASKYYGNSAERYRSREEKHHSLTKLAKRLAERKVAYVSKSSLANCVAAHFQERQLDLTKSDAELLSFAARVALLREMDPVKKAGLARRAIDERLSVRELRVLVRGGIAATGKSPADRLLELATKIERMIRLGFPVDYENVDLVMVAINYLERSAATLREASKDALPEQ